jgi:hypothetical protein
MAAWPADNNIRRSRVSVTGGRADIIPGLQLLFAPLILDSLFEGASLPGSKIIGTIAERLKSQSEGAR